MKNSMIILKDNGVRHFNTCATCPIDFVGGAKPAEKNLTFKTYYSNGHARKNGWVYTADPQACPPERPAVWVCPECMEKYFKV